MIESCSDDDDLVSVHVCGSVVIPTWVTKFDLDLDLDLDLDYRFRFCVQANQV